MPLGKASGARQNGIMSNANPKQRSGKDAAMPERITLADFVADLPDETAAETRAAAARIDELVRVGAAMEGVEARFRRPAIAAAVLLVIGLLLFFNPDLANRWIMVACLAALPVVAIVYARQVMDRSRADARIEDLNRAHFLPHGGFYFPPGNGPALVVRVDYKAPERELPLSEAPRDPRKRRDTGPERLW